MLTNLIGSLFVLFGLVLSTPTPCTYNGVPTRNNGYKFAAWLENAANGNFFDVQLSQTEAVPACATVVSGSPNDLWIYFDAQMKYVRKYTWNPTTFLFDPTSTRWNVSVNGNSDYLQIYALGSNLAIMDQVTFSQYNTAGIRVPTSSPSGDIIDATFFPSVGTSYQVGLTADGTTSFILGFGQEIRRFDENSNRLDNPYWTQSTWQVNGVSPTGTGIVTGATRTDPVYVIDNTNTGPIYLYSSTSTTGTLWLTVGSRIYGIAGSSTHLFVETAANVYVYARGTTAGAVLKTYTNGLSTGTARLWTLPCTFADMNRYVPPPLPPPPPPPPMGTAPAAPIPAPTPCPSGTYICQPGSPPSASTCTPCPGTPPFPTGTGGPGTIILATTPTSAGSSPTSSSPCLSQSYAASHCGECGSPPGYCCPPPMTRPVACPSSGASASGPPSPPPTPCTDYTCCDDTNCPTDRPYCTGGSTANAECVASTASLLDAFFSLF